MVLCAANVLLKNVFCQQIFDLLNVSIIHLFRRAFSITKGALVYFRNHQNHLYKKANIMPLTDLFK